MHQLPVFYINLASRPGRRGYMEEQFTRLGIAAERVEAVTAADVPSDIIARHADPRRLWPISNGDSHDIVQCNPAPCERLPSSAMDMPQARSDRVAADDLGYTLRATYLALREGVSARRRVIEFASDEHY